MKTIKILYFLGMLLCVNTYIFAQAEYPSLCPPIEEGQQKTPWWYDEYWTVNTETSTTPLYRVKSPFFAQSEAFGISNIYSVYSTPAGEQKDFLYEKGWRCIKKQVGTSQNREDLVRYPYFVFYNKYTSKIRLFILVTNPFEASSGNANAETAYIEIKPRKSEKLNDLPGTRYIPNTLTQLSNPSETVSEYAVDRKYKIPQSWENSSVRFWLMAEFPIAYDPCTCLTTSREQHPIIDFVVYTVKEQKVDLCNFGVQPGDKKCEVVATTATTAKDAVLSDILGDIKKIGSVGKTIGEHKSSITTAFDFLYKVDLNVSLQEDYYDLNNPFGFYKAKDVVKYAKYRKARSTLENITETIPNISVGILSAVTGAETILPLLGFVLGVEKQSGGMGFTPFKTEGTISSVAADLSGSFLVPGSSLSNVNPADWPGYDNVMGVMNVLNRPVLHSKYQIERGYNFDSGHFYFEVAETPQIVINPALDIDLSQSEINVSFEFENQLRIPTKRLTHDRASNARMAINMDFTSWQRIKSGGLYPFYMTPSFPLSCAKGKSFSYHGLQNAITVSAGNGAVLIGTSYSFDLPKTGTVFMKVHARLRRKLSTNQTKYDDIVFINRYAVDIKEYDEKDFEIRRQQHKSSINNFTNRGDHLTYDGWYPGHGVFDDWDSGNYPVEANQTLAIIGGYDIPENVTQFYAGKSVDILPIDAEANDSAVELRAGTEIGINNSFDIGSNPICNNLSLSQILNQVDVRGFCNERKYKANHNFYRSTISQDSQASTSDLITDLRVYPNPATGTSVDMTYSLSEKATANLHIYNAKGEKVGVLVNESKDAGKYDITWDINQIPNGLYFCTLEINGKRIVKRLIIQK